MIGQGLIQAVRIATAGSYLAADAALAATSLVLESVLDFSTDGGQLTLNGVTYTYTAADYDTGTLTLSSGLTGAALTVDRVDVSPLSTEKLALVTTAGPGDAVSARIPHALVDRVPEGIREPGDEESVQYSLDNGEFVITDVVGRQPVIGIEYIDPALTGKFPITATDIAPGAISTPQLAANAIDGMTITGALLRTAATGRRVEIDSPTSANEIRFYTGSVGETAPGLVQVAAGEVFLSSPNLGAGQSFVEISGAAGKNEVYVTADDGIFLRGDGVAHDNQIWVSAADGAVMSANGNTHQIWADAAGIALWTDGTANPITVQSGSGGVDLKSTGGTVRANSVPVVTTTDTQTLTNKTLTSPTITGSGAITANSINVGGSTLNGLYFGTFSGTTDAAGKVTISHTLGATPTAVFVTAQNSLQYAAASAPSSTNCDVFIRNLAAAGAPVLPSTATTVRYMFLA